MGRWLVQYAREVSLYRAASSSSLSSIDSVDGMKRRLPALRERLNTDPSYFKKVYIHTFDLIKAPGSRTLTLDSAVDFWTLFIPPALSSRPSALSHISPGESSASSSTSQVPQFTQNDFDMWVEFQRKKGKAVSKDTWALFVDFIRSIDSEFKQYDESGECHCTSWSLTSRSVAIDN